jgi:hypothetical protein
VDWAQLKNQPSIVQSVVTSLAIVIGGAWALYRFSVFRTLKPRVGFSFEFEIVSLEPLILIVRAKASNVGNTRLELRGKRHGCYLRYALLRPMDAGDNFSVMSRSRGKLEAIDYIFQNHGYMEPGEVIDDAKVISIPHGCYSAVQTELEVFGEYYSFLSRRKKIRSAAGTAFSLIEKAGVKAFQSDDEEEADDEETISRGEIISALQVLKIKIMEKAKSANTDQEVLTASKDADELLRRLLNEPEPKSGHDPLLDRCEALIDRLDRLLRR